MYNPPPAHPPPWNHLHRCLLRHDMKYRSAATKLAFLALILLAFLFRDSQRLPLLHLFASRITPPANNGPTAQPAQPAQPSPRPVAADQTPLPCAPNRSALINLLLAPDPDLPGVLRDYVKWHARARVCLLDPGCQARTPVRVLLSHCAPGPFCLGLGDRMRGVYYTFLVAVATNRLFLLEWPREPFDLTAAVLPAAVDWRVPPRMPPPADWPTLQWGWCIPTPNLTCLPRGRFNDTAIPQPGHEASGETLDLLRDDVEAVLSRHERLTLVTRRNRVDTAFLRFNPHLKQRFAALQTEWAPGALHGDGAVVAAEHFVLRTLFRPAPQVAQRVAALDLPQRFVAIHARVGGATGESGNERFKPYLKAGMATVAWQLLKCARDVRKHAAFRRTGRAGAGHSGTDSGLFIAADSALLRARLARQAGKHGMSLLTGDTPEETVQSDEAARKEGAMHVSLAWRSREQPRKQRCERFQQVFVDLFALAQAQEIVALAASHFSGAAAALGRARLTLVEQPNVPGHCVEDRQMHFSPEQERSTVATKS